MTGKMIIYLPNWLGDMIMATPFLFSLRASYQGEIWAIGEKKAFFLYKGLDLFDRFITFEKKDLPFFLKMVFALRKERFSTGIILPHSFRSALLFYLSEIERRIGYDVNWRGFLLTDRLERRKESTVLHYLRLLEPLGIEKKLDTPVLKVTEEERRKFFDKNRDLFLPYGAFIIGASFGPSKIWPLEYFSELAERIRKAFDMKILLLPGPKENQIGERILNLCREKEGISVRYLDISELKACLSEAKFVVTNDTGPRHIASAFSVPTFVLIGPMDECYTSYRTERTYLFMKDLSCRPCNKKICPKDHSCMRLISVDEVFQKIREVLFGSS